MARKLKSDKFLFIATLRREQVVSIDLLPVRIAACQVNPAAPAEDIEDLLSLTTVAAPRESVLSEARTSAADV